jgi:Spy/CpxP family protein refolding chaperone
LSRWRVLLTKGRILGLKKSNPNLRSYTNMKTSKISLAVVLALALTLGLAASSWARPGGGGMGCGMMGAMNLTPDQAGKLFDLKEKFRTDTVAVRKGMMVKHAELAALWKAEKPDQTAITAKQKEVNALRDQMQEKRTAFMLEARKIAPELAKGFGRGMGYGMHHGGGMGHGGCPMVGGGTGPGPKGPGGAPAPAPPAK